MQNFRGPLAALLLAAAVPAQAVEWQAAVGGDLRWFDWREYQGGGQLLMERGVVVAPTARLELYEGPWFARVDSLVGGGFARYDGHLQSGPAYEADAWEGIVDTHWRLGVRVERLELSAGLLQRDWNRYIDGSATVSSAEERYRWRIATLGGAVTLPREQPLRVSLDLGVPVKSYQKVYSSQYDDFTLEPGDGVWWRVGLSWRLSANPALSLEPWYQEQYMDDSDPVRLKLGGVAQALQAYQPESVRRELGVTLRLSFGAGQPAP